MKCMDKGDGYDGIDCNAPCPACGELGKWYQHRGWRCENYHCDVGTFCYNESKRPPKDTDTTPQDSDKNYPIKESPPEPIPEIPPTQGETESKINLCEEYCSSDEQEVCPYLDIGKQPTDTEEECLWKNEEDTDNWGTFCVHRWTMLADSSWANGMHFCPYCGKVLRGVFEGKDKKSAVEVEEEKGD